VGSYLILKHLHLTLVVLSGLGFALRGFIRLGLDKPLRHPTLKVGPHLLDTLLLISGVGLWWGSQYPLASWFGIKLLLVLAYIGVSITAFRLSSRSLAVMTYLLGLLCFLLIALLSMQRVA